MRRGFRVCLLACAVLLLGAETEDPLHGFRLDGLSVSRDKVRPAARKRDPIPVVNEPRYVPAAEASWVAGDTPVIGVVVGGEARAFPVHLMEYHHVVNAVVGGVPVAVTFDPLTAVPRAYRRDLDGKRLEFAVSGLVYNSGALLFDRETESLWSQFRGDAVAGRLVGKRLTRLPVRQEVLAKWLARQPDTQVLVRPEPQRIDYRYSPYKAYWIEDQIPFPVEARDDRFHAKEVVLGIEAGGTTRAYLGSVVTRAGLHVEDSVPGGTIVIDYRPEEAVFEWQAPDAIAVTDAYWFAWKAFHPETEIWEPSP